MWDGGYDIWSKRCLKGNVKIIVQFVYVRLYYSPETDYCTYYQQVKAIRNRICKVLTRKQPKYCDIAPLNKKTGTFWVLI